MNRELQIQKLVPVIIEPDEIGLDVQAALTENDEGVDFAIPNVTFEVRVGMEKVYEGKSDAGSGVFVAKNIPIGRVEPRFNVAISAKDEVGGLTVKVHLDIERLMKEMESRLKELKEEEKDQEPILTPEMAEKERQIKEAIKKALDQLLIRKHSEQTNDDGNLLIYFDVDTDKWMESGKNVQYTGYTTLDQDTERKYARDITKNKFKILVEQHSHPLVKREIADFAKQRPHLFIQYAHLYYEASWAEAVISELARQEPQKILEKVKEFYQYNWAKNIVAQIAKANPSLAFSQIELYEYQPWAEEIATKAAKFDPASAIEHYNKYRDQPWAESVLRFARKKKEEDDLAATKNAAQQRLAREAAERAAAEAVKANSARLAERNKTWEIDFAIGIFQADHNAESELKAFEIFVKYQDDERVVSAVNALVQSHPVPFFIHREIYISAACGKQVTEKLTACHPITKHYLLLERFYGKSFTPESLAAELDYAIANRSSGVANDVLSIVFECFEKCRSLPWAKDIAVKIAENYPVHVIDKFDTFRSQPWTTDVLRTAAPKIPGVNGTTDFLKKTLTVYADYDGEPWCQELLAVMRERLKKTELQDEERQWMEQAQKDPVNTVPEVFANHIDKPWASAVLEKTLLHPDQVACACQTIYRSLDLYASKPWGKKLYLETIKRHAAMPISTWPINTYGWDDEIIDIVSKSYKADLQRNQIPAHNGLIRFCSSHPNNAVTIKFRTRLQVTDPAFAMFIQKPNAVLAFFKGILGQN